jgi:hypothetical protein
LCGFNNLEREERLSRAHEILNSNELKQAICHEILGTTFKDVERAMEAILKERQLTPAQEEELELRKTIPEKFEPEFDPDLEFKINKKAADHKKESGYRTHTREEVAELLAASKAPCEPTPQIEKTEYPTMTREECERLVREHYEYLAEQKKKKEEYAAWDSQKMTESELKTKNTKKPTKSTKD